MNPILGNDTQCCTVVLLFFISLFCVGWITNILSTDIDRLDITVTRPSRTFPVTIACMKPVSKLSHLRQGGLVNTWLHFSVAACLTNHDMQYLCSNDLTPLSSKASESLVLALGWSHWRRANGLDHCHDTTNKTSKHEQYFKKNSNFMVNIAILFQVAVASRFPTALGNDSSRSFKSCFWNVICFCL